MTKGRVCLDVFDVRQQHGRGLERETMEQPGARRELLVPRVGRGGAEQVEGVLLHVLTLAAATGIMC
jgi:hypothetical protein